MTNRTVSDFRKAFSGTEAAIRFLRMIDDEQITGVSVKVRPVDLDARERAGTAPPERDPRPGEESRVIGSDSDIQGPLVDLSVSDDSDDSDGGTPDRGDGDGEIPTVYRDSDDCRRRLLPGGSYHHTLYLVAIYEHKTGAVPTNEDLYEYFGTEYDSESQVSPCTSILHKNFGVLDRENADNKAGSWCYAHSVNEKGMQYLRTHGYPSDRPYAVPEHLRYEIAEVDDAGA